MCFWILPNSGIPIARTTVCAMSEVELQTDAVKQELCSYDQAIQRKLGHHLITEIDLFFEINSNELSNALADASDDDDGYYDPIEPEA
jgi:hypothetical protein